MKRVVRSTKSPARRVMRLGLIGFGSVNRALARILLERREEIARRHRLEFVVTLVASARRGALVDPKGIDLSRALETGWSEKTTTLDALSGAPLDLVFEGTPLDPKRGEPATSHVRTALARGVSVVSANKGPVAFAVRDLVALARRTGAGFRFESAVADCMPVFDLVEFALPIGRVTAFHGVLNSTSNHVLQAIARGASADQAIAEMQRQGVAEADPSHDLDGWDQAVKASILAQVLLGRPLLPDAVARTPLSRVDVGWLRATDRAGRVVRLAASGRLEGAVRVAPESFEPGDFLASLPGISLGLSLLTDLAGRINVAAIDAGVEQTAFGMLSDLIAIHHGRNTIPSPLWGDEAEHSGRRPRTAGTRPERKRRPANPARRQKDGSRKTSRPPR